MRQRVERSWSHGGDHAGGLTPPPGDAIQDPPRRRRRLGRILLDEERVTEISLAAALAQAHGLRAVDLSQEEIDTDVARSIPQVVAMKAPWSPCRGRTTCCG